MSELMTSFAAITTDISRARGAIDLADPFRHVKRDLLREAEAILSQATLRAQGILFAIESLNELKESGAVAPLEGEG